MSLEIQEVYVLDEGDSGGSFGAREVYTDRDDALRSQKGFEKEYPDLVYSVYAINLYKRCV